MRGASHRRLSVIAVMAVSLALAVAAAAQECPSACGLQKRACVQGARATKLGCKMDCRANAPHRGVGACMRACMTSFRSDKDACGSDHAGCMTECRPGGPPAGAMCRMMCGHDFATCTQAAIADARTCMHGCPNGRERRPCVDDCGSTARDAAAACADTFDECTSACGGSPSGAFLD